MWKFRVGHAGVSRCLLCLNSLGSTPAPFTQPFLHSGLAGGVGWRLHTARHLSLPSEPACLLSRAGKWLSDDREMAASSKKSCHLWEATAPSTQTVFFRMSLLSFPARPAHWKLWFLSTCTRLPGSTELWSVVLEDPTKQTGRHQSKEQGCRLSGWLEGCCSLDLECSSKVKQ